MQYDEIRPLIVEATERLERAINTLDDPHHTASLLPGWSQAHVLTHLARNADGMRNLFLAARSGHFVGMYASAELREADIMTGATRPAELLALDVRVAAERLGIDLDAMPETAWAAAVPMSADPDAMQVPAPVLALFRLAEVELHHVDLAAGASLADVSDPGLDALLRVCHLRLRERTPPFTLTVRGSARPWGFGPTDTADEPVQVTGDAAAAVGWLTGRNDGSSLATEGSTALPPLPSY